MRRSELARAWEADDETVLRQALADKPLLTLRYLGSRLCSADDDEKWRAVQRIGALCADTRLVPLKTLKELLRDFAWLLSDESGAVPYGVPEAMGEILARRRELLSSHLPPLLALLAEAERFQTGPVLDGVLWAIGRVAGAEPGLPLRMRELLDREDTATMAPAQRAALEQARGILLDVEQGTWRGGR
jgi:hypothetical protein